MLLRQVERIRRIRGVDALVVATSLDPSDDPIVELCEQAGIACFRGSLADVLDRFYQAAKPYRPEHVVRLTGDCPLVDPTIVDRLISMHGEGGFDYSSNALIRTFPDGLDAEIMRFEALENAWQEAQLPSEREHVTPFLYKHPEQFRIGTYTQERDLSAMRWTVDEAPDFELISRIYEALYPNDPAFGMQDILRFLETSPELLDLNKQYQCNEGYQRSLAKDALLLENPSLPKRS
jgi:Spore coat polysaccharide biosynthesis protein F, CMP-KDO synthetase homolog